MKKSVCIALLFSFFAAASQTTTSPKKVPPQKSAPGKYREGTTQVLVNNLLHEPCLNKKFSVIFYVIQDSINSLPATISTYSLTKAIDILNSTFSCICVSFEHCKTVVIPNYSYNKWTPNKTGPAAFQNYYTENTINIYVPDGILGPMPDVPEPSYTFPPPPAPPATGTTTDAIVIAKSALTSTNEMNFAGSMLLHAMGHFFGLPHTSDEINPAGAGTVIPGPPSSSTPPVKTLEYVSRANMQNCLEHGDGFCDTEADPYPSAIVGNTVNPAGWGNCLAAMGLKDGHGDFYIGPCDNAMSLYIKTRCRFSVQQYNYMADIIVTRRLYLH